MIRPILKNLARPLIHVENHHFWAIYNHFSKTANNCALCVVSDCLIRSLSL